MTTKTNSTKLIRNVFVQDAYTIGKTFNAMDVANRPFDQTSIKGAVAGWDKNGKQIYPVPNAKDSVRPSTSGVQGVQPSTVGIGRRNDKGTQGNSAGVRPIKPTTANGAFKVGTGGAAGNRSAADIEAIKKAAFEKGVRDYHDKRVRDGHHAALQRNEDWVADRINSRSVDDAGMRALLGGA